MKSIKRFFSTYSLPILTGFFIGTSFIPFPPWASVFAFVPLWIYLFKQESAKRVFWGAWISSFVLTLIGFNWVAHTMHEFGQLPWPAAIFTLLAFCGFANLDVPLAALGWYFLKRRFGLKGTTSLAVLALLTALFERYVPTIFSWNYGFPFYWVGLPLYQIAELIGFQGISSLVILGNVLTFQAWQAGGTANARRPLVILIAAFALLNMAGWALVRTLPSPDRSTRILITQANIGNLEKHAQRMQTSGDLRDSIIQKYLNLTREALESQKVDLVVWPETAFPVTIYSPDVVDHYVDRLRNLAQKYQTYFITGGYSYDLDQRKVTNSFFIFEPTGQLNWPAYQKTILLAFGEYMPLGDTFPELRDRFPVGNFAHGYGPRVKSVGDLQVGPQICYESLFPFFSKSLADQGAQIIMNLTNDSWYGTWQEPYQHLYMTLARAIEFRRPVVRSTNTGISTVALADGRILEKSPLEKEWTHVFNVPYFSQPRPTLYQKFPWLMDIVLIVLLGVALLRGGIARTPQP